MQRVWPLRSRHLLIAVLVGIIAIAISSTYEQQRVADRYREHHAEYCAALVAPAEQKKACKEEGITARDYSRWWYTLISWPEGITTWALIGTGFLIAWQALETRKAAQASVVQAEHMIASERPFLMVEALGDATNVCLKIVNRGKSPAKVVYLEKLLWPKIKPSDEELPTPPSYDSGYQNVKGWRAL